MPHRCIPPMQPGRLVIAPSCSHVWPVGIRLPWPTLPWRHLTQKGTSEGHTSQAAIDNMVTFAEETAETRPQVAAWRELGAVLDAGHGGPPRD